MIGSYQRCLQNVNIFVHHKKELYLKIPSISNIPNELKHFQIVFRRDNATWQWIKRGRLIDNKITPYRLRAKCLRHDWVRTLNISCIDFWGWYHASSYLLGKGNARFFPQQLNGGSPIEGVQSSSILAIPNQNWSPTSSFIHLALVCFGWFHKFSTLQ